MIRGYYNTTETQMFETLRSCAPLRK